MKIIEHQRLYGASQANIIMPYSLINNDDKFLKTRATKIFQQIQEVATKEPTPCGVIHPSSTFKSVWNIGVLTLLLYTATVTPFLLAFTDDPSFGTIFWIESTVSLLFFMDFIVNLSSAYYDKDQVLVSSRKKIFLEYLKSWMLIDFMSWFPLDLIQGTSSTSSKQLVRFARIPKFYRLLRISRVFKLLKSHFHTEMMEKLQEALSLKHSAMRMIRSYLSIAICVHIFSCFWYLAAKLYGFGPNTWVVRGNFQDEDILSLYITCVYWAITTLATVGYGDIVPVTELEISLAMIWMAFGLYFFSFTIGSLNSMLLSMDLKENILENKLAVIDEFVSDANLTKELRRKLKKSLEYASNKRGVSWHDKRNIIDELPKNLRYEIAINMHHGAAKLLNFFANKDKSLIALIVPLLDPVFVEKGGWVYKDGDFADEIYFIVKGNVRISIENSINIKSIQRGSYFGDIELFRNISRRYSAVSTRYSEMLIMNLATLKQIKNDHNNVWQEMYQAALERERNYEKIIIEVKEIEKLYHGTKLSRIDVMKYNARVEQILAERMKALGKKIDVISISNLVKRVEDLAKFCTLNKRNRKNHTRIMHVLKSLKHPKGLKP